MTREVKVGLAVILVLLAVFGVVVASRLRREARQAADLSAPQDEGPSLAPALSKATAHETLKGDTYTASRPTIVAPETEAGGAASASPAEVGQWSSPAQSPAQAAVDSSAGAPSYMPNPPQPYSSSPYERYGSAYGSSPAQQAWQSPPAGPAPLPADQGADPFQGRVSGSSPNSPNSSPYPAAEQQPATGLPSLRLVDPSGQAAGGSSGAAQSPPNYGTSSQAYQAAPYGAQVQTTPGNYSSGSLQGSAQRPAATTGSPWQSNLPGYSAASSGYSGSDYAAPDSAFGKSGSGLPSLQTPAVRREDGTYVVQPNDSFWTISEKFYGTGAYFRALAEHNRSRIASQERLAVGDVISVPDLSELEANYAHLCPKPQRREAVKTQVAALASAGLQSGGPTYTVQEGDTLFDIARYELGDARRWVEIYQLNRHILGEDFNYLRPGLKLVLPGEPGVQDPVTRRPGYQDAYQR